MMKRIKNAEFRGHIGPLGESGYKFSGCKFIDCHIPSIINCQFSNCVFENAIFAHTQKASENSSLVPPEEEQGLVKSIVASHFFDCKFKKTIVKNAAIEDLAFTDCDFTGFDFFNSTFVGKLSVINCRNIGNLKMDMDCRFSENFIERIRESNSGLSSKAFKWTNIKIFSQLPIPKIGFSTIIAGLILLPVIDLIMTRACIAFIGSAKTTASIEEPSGRSESLEKCLATIPDASLLMNWTSVFLLLLLGTSIMHKLVEPKIITLYSSTQWGQEFKRSSFQYTALNNNHPAAISGILLLYVISISKLSYDYFTKIFPY